MILTDLHMHTTYCDGENTPEEMMLSALEKGMKKIGLSEHSHIPFDRSGGMAADDVQRYIYEINSLKEKYRGKIEILCGIEQDYYSDTDTTAYDYVIGSVHYLQKDGVFFSIDETPEILKQAVDMHYDGDILSLAEEYYDTLTSVVEKTRADIIGHFDLISKYIESGIALDTDDSRYIKAWKHAADRLIMSGKPFEINTGAIARGWRSTPYPDIKIIDYIKRNGGRFILSSDSHSADMIAYGFDRFEYLL